VAPAVSRQRTPAATLLVACLVVASGCSSAGGEEVLARSGGLGGAPPVSSTATPVLAVEPPPEPPTTTTTVAAVAAVTTAPPAPTAPTPAVPPPTSVALPAPPRLVVEQPWTPFASVGGLVLVHPSSRVERVGFHQSNHDGAQQLEPLATAVGPTTLETRHRPTGSRTAADVVVDPGVEIRAPVTGTVARAGTYVLYCDYSDDYAVIRPDGQPGWEVKILHIDGVRVGAGDRVTAGETVIAGGPTPLPFESQVDELTTADRPWPHVHIEVIDPAIPDLPSPGGGCGP
jgi:biotin carboxyl carrier protein